MTNNPHHAFHVENAGKMDFNQIIYIKNKNTKERKKNRLAATIHAVKGIVPSVSVVLHNLPSVNFHFRERHVF